MSDMTLVLSDRWEEARTAMRIVHDGFVEAGYMEPMPSGLRLIGPYLNPGTTFAIVKRAGIPVASAAMMADGPFGLPADRAFVEETDGLRPRYRRVLEYGSLTVEASQRSSNRLIYPYLCGAALRLGIEHDDQTVVVVVEPEQLRFFQMLTAAEQIAEERPLYGAPGIILHIPPVRTRDHLQNPPSALARRMAELSLTPDPEWLSDLRGTGGPWPADELEALADEQGLTDRIGRQLGLLTERMPQLSERLRGC